MNLKGCNRDDDPLKFWENPLNLADEVLGMIRQIPAGWITTYGELARAIGDERTRSARWLGELLHHHSHSPDCPCHRVVRSNGEIGLYVTDVPEEKRQLLLKEGVPVSATGMVDLTRLFTEFQSSRPLEKLRLFQLKLRERVVQQPLRKAIRSLSAVDVAYRPDGTGHAAFVTLDAETCAVQQERTLSLPVQFPYIPGYLTFRELPIILQLCRQARDEGILGDVLFCDGNGLLHPWGGGIATCLGVLLDHPTLGVGKSLLCGKIQESDANPAALPIDFEGETRGMAIRLSPNSRPVYISVGHRLTLNQATKIALAALRSHRVPEPIYYADRLTKIGKSPSKKAHEN